MTDIEERLRQDLNKLAERAQPGSIRPLRVPPAGGRSRTVRSLAPVAAAAAVIGLVAGISLASRSARHQSLPAETSAGMPPYYVTLVTTVHPQRAATKTAVTPTPVPATITQTAVVRDSATGTVLATVQVPAGGTPPGAGGITAAADDQTFAITNGDGIFLLRITAGGRSAQLRQLPLSPDQYITGVAAALSPDGSRLAIAVEQQRCPASGCSFGIEVLSLATGDQSTWWWSSHGVQQDLSWAGNGKQVMFLATGVGLAGYRLLDTARPAGSLLTASRPMSFPVPPLYGLALLTPDGRTIITSAARTVPGHDGGGTVIAQIVELSARDGRLLRVLHVATARYTRQHPAVLVMAGCGVLSLGSAGLHALVQCFNFGRIQGSQFTPLPGIPSQPSYFDGAAW